MRSPTRPAPPPLQVNAGTVVAVGTVVWFAAFVLVLVFHGRLVDAGHGDWLWITLAGWALGLIGLPLTWLQTRAAGRRAGRRTADRSPR